MAKILVADDNRISRELIRDVLEAPGREVLEAADGQEALQRIIQEEPDLVLLDIEMPVLDGLAVLRELRRNPRLASRPVLAVTANAMQGDRERVLAAGFDGYIAKPIHNSRLREIVEQLLENVE